MDGSLRLSVGIEEYVWLEQISQGWEVGIRPGAGKVKGAQWSRWWCRWLHLVLVSWGLLGDFEKKTRACLSSHPFPPRPAPATKCSI